MTDDETKKTMNGTHQMQEIYDHEMKKWTESLFGVEVPSRRTLALALSLRTREELADIAYNLNVKELDEADKEKLAETLTPIVLDFSAKWFQSIGKEQYLLFEHLASSGGLSVEIVSPDARLDYVRSLGILSSGHVNGKFAWYMPEEILSAYQSPDRAKFKETVAYNETISRLAAGMLFYYGYLPYEEMYRRIKKLTRHEALSFIEFWGVVTNAACWTGVIVGMEHGMRYHTLTDTDALLAALNERPDLSYREFSYDELFRAGGANYIEDSDPFKALAGFFIKEVSLAAIDAADLTLRLEIILLNGGGLPDMIRYALSHVKSPNPKIREYLKSLLASLAQAKRQWRLKGHSPSELSADWPKAGALSKANKRMENVVKFVPLNAEIGRNDPCPCGSGKKYKNCCL